MRIKNMMNNNMIGTRIKQRRYSFGLSLQDVANRMNHKGEKITRAGLSKYENNLSIPRAKFLWVLAKVLGVKNDYFFKDSEVLIKWIAFRKHASLTRRMEEQIKGHVQEVLEGQLFLEKIMKPEKMFFSLKKRKITSVEEAEDIAESIRYEWKLNEWPIESVTQLLEDKSFYVIEYDFKEKKFDGLSGLLNEKAPVVVTKKNVSIDRKRFNLSHELGHQVLDVDDIPDFEEAAAHRFAAAFLFPKICAFNEIGEKRKKIDINELMIIKEKYGISLQAILRRCKDLKIISDSYYKSLFIDFSRKGWRTVEPGECGNFEEAVLFKRLVLKAIAEGIITEEKALEIYSEYEEMIQNSEKKTKWKWKDLRNMSTEDRNKILESAANMAKDDYEHDENLMGFNVEEDIYE